MVVNLLPSTPQSRGLLSCDRLLHAAAQARALGQSWPSPLFINVGRGDVIEDTEILYALNQGTCIVYRCLFHSRVKAQAIYQTIACLSTPLLCAGLFSHAVLDVFATEPLAATSPLWRHPGVSITPHVAAPSYPEDVINVFLDNLNCLAEGRELAFAVDWDKGY